MKSRRGSFGTSESSGFLLALDVGDVVTAVANADSSFIGIVKNINDKTNKVLVAWGGGSLVQHDPDELMLYPWQHEAVKMKMASRRTTVCIACIDDKLNPKPVQSKLRSRRK